MNWRIADILSLSRIQAKDIPLAIQPIDLGKMVSAIIKEAGFEARSRGCRINFADNFPGTVSGNCDLLHSAVENILRNALIHTGTGTTVDVSIEHFESDKTRPVSIRIRDDGPGVPEKDLPGLFQPFYRVLQHRSTSGLGLAIARGAVERHGGTITAATPDKGGLEIEIRLPVAPQVTKV